MERVGQYWSKGEDAKLTKGFEDGKEIEELAKIHGRSMLAIRYRLQKLELIPTIDIPTTDISTKPRFLHNNNPDTECDNVTPDIITEEYHNVLYLYILKLKGDKYYVGTTEDLSRRFYQHWSGLGSEWTKKYPPLEILTVSRDKTPLDEDHEVKKLMLIHGVDNVRGGSYSQCNLNQEQFLTLGRELNHGRGGCFRCHSLDHWVKDCPVDVTPQIVVTPRLIQGETPKVAIPLVKPQEPPTLQSDIEDLKEVVINILPSTTEGSCIIQ